MEQSGTPLLARVAKHERSTGKLKIVEGSAACRSLAFVTSGAPTETWKVVAFLTSKEERRAVTQ